jgi:hypothetical protein
VSIPLLIAGIIATTAAFVHSIAGEATTIRPLVAAGLKDIPKLELRTV